MGFQYGLCSALVAHGFRNYHDVSVFFGVHYHFADSLLHTLNERGSTIASQFEFMTFTRQLKVRSRESPEPPVARGTSCFPNPSFHLGAMVLRMAKGEHVRTFWPLMLQCGSEDGDNYSAGFEKLHAELIEWGIPSPSQVHLDWFSSSKKAAQRVWPRAVVCRSIQHLRRNLLRNHRKGRRPPHPRKKKTKDHADSRRNRRNCSQPRLGEKKPKLAPHLKEKSIFAFFDLFNRLMLVPSLSMHHLLLEIVLRRISNVWGDTSWVQYFEEQYCSKKRVDAELYGVDQAGCCCCCCHFFYILAL